MVVSIPFARRLYHAVGEFFLGGLFVWMAVLFLLQMVLLPDWPPPTRAKVAAAIAAPLMAAICAFRYRQRFYQLTISDAIRLERPAGQIEFPLDDVQALVGLGGINIDGGNLLVWKRTLIAGPSNTVKISFGHQLSRQIYDALKAHCPRSWGLPYRGSLEAPRSLDEQPGTNADREGLNRVAAVLTSWMLRSLGAGLLLLTTVSAGTIGLFLYAPAEETEAAAQAGIYFIVAAVLAVLLLGDAYRQYKRRRKLRASETSL